MLSTLLGKGASMHDGALAAGQELVVYLDGDLASLRAGIISDPCRPLLAGEADFVKARFGRGGDRVTELAAKPMLKAFFPEVAGFALVPRFIEHHVPSGARGLLVAAILAAAMSSLDSALNSLSASTLRDFVEPHLGSTRALQAGRIVTLLWGVAIMGFAAVASSFSSSVVESINRVGALFYGPLLAAFACGILLLAILLALPGSRRPRAQRGAISLLDGWALLCLLIMLWLGVRHD